MISPKDPAENKNIFELPLPRKATNLCCLTLVAIKLELRTQTENQRVKGYPPPQCCVSEQIKLRTQSLQTSFGGLNNPVRPAISWGSWHWLPSCIFAFQAAAWQKQPQRFGPEKLNGAERYKSYHYLLTLMFTNHPGCNRKTTIITC